MLSKVTPKNVGDVFFETHCSLEVWESVVVVIGSVMAPLIAAKDTV